MHHSILNYELPISLKNGIKKLHSLLSNCNRFWGFVKGLRPNARA